VSTRWVHPTCKLTLTSPLTVTLTHRQIPWCLHLCLQVWQPHHQNHAPHQIHNKHNSTYKCPCNRTWLPWDLTCNARVRGQRCWNHPRRWWTHPAQSCRRPLRFTWWHQRLQACIQTLWWRNPQLHLRLWSSRACCTLITAVNVHASLWQPWFTPVVDTTSRSSTGAHARPFSL